MPYLCLQVRNVIQVASTVPAGHLVLRTARPVSFDRRTNLETVLMIYFIIVLENLIA